MTETTFTIDAGFDRSRIWSGGDSVRHLVVRVRADGPEPQFDADRPALNIALAIDASGSMSGGKLDAAKEAALGFLDRLSARDRLTIVSFATDVQVHVDALPVSPDNAVRIREEILSLRTRGMTCLSGGWFAAADRAARAAESDAALTPRVIILSDGHANEGIRLRRELWHHAAELCRRGVLTSAFGIGDGYDEELLRGIAENGGGRLHDAEFAYEIGAVLLGELDDILGTVLEKAQLDFTVPAGVHVEAFGTRTLEMVPGAEGGPRRLTLPIGAVQRGVERRAVLKLTCPAAREGEELAVRIKASAQLTAEGVRRTAPTVTAALTAEGASDNDAQERDEARAEMVARAWSAHVVARAGRMNSRRAPADAKGYVEQELSFFRPYVTGLSCGDDLLRDLEVLARRIGRQLSSRMQKELALQTTLAAENRRDRRGPGKQSWHDRLTPER